MRDNIVYIHSDHPVSQNSSDRLEISEISGFGYFEFHIYVFNVCVYHSTPVLL